MKRIFSILILPALVVAGCASATQTAPPVEVTNTQTALPVEVTTTQAPTTTATALPEYPTPTEEQLATLAYPAPTSADLTNQGYPAAIENQPTMGAYPYPVDTKTGIVIVDNVIAAATSNDHQGLVDLIHYTNAKCTKAEGLGGPPKCLDAEAEGTPVDVLPLLGPEGSFIRKEDIETDFFQGQFQLLAVFQVKPDANPDPDYPAGIYGILLMRTDLVDYKTLRVDDQGIVRIDTEMGTLGKDFPKADEFILQLKTQN